MANESLPESSGAAEEAADLSGGGYLAKRSVFRLLLAEYQLLSELAIGPVELEYAAPSVIEAIDFLATQDLAEKHGTKAVITDRGRRVAIAEPLSRTTYTIAFDRNRLGW